ncbi:MAG: hypothetical protein GEU90_15475 [Gemmatimonas sp.]|nr:hypothetical protein [Gemmatimonas sp.]
MKSDTLHPCFRLALIGVFLLLPDAVGAQVRTEVRTSALYESYGFDDGLGVDNISEASLAMTAATTVGDRVNLTMATGYSRVSAGGADGQAYDMSGILDTELRFTVEALPDRLTVFGIAQIPNGQNSFEQDDRALVQVLANDVIGFATPNLGSGGGAGGGFALAVPAGPLAVGAALSYQASFAYSPFAESAAELHPGNEFRLRMGIEGPLARRSFLRLSGIFARRAGAEWNSAPTDIGNLYSGYASFQQGFESSSLTLYLFELYRASGALEQTAVGPALLPRSNVFAAGAQWAYTFADEIQIMPRLELRDSRSALTDSGPLEPLGRTLRVGVDLRRRMTEWMSAVIQGDGVTGSLTAEGADIGVSGYRISAHLQFAP